jgi:ABC-2 type transport system ATP-binding protein
MSDTAIEVEELAKTYPGGVEAVRRISFDVSTGETFGLLGPNGAGKSTTIGILTTSVRPTGGRARVAGFDVQERPVDARRASSVVFQDPVVDRSFTGRRNLETHARLWAVAPAAASARIGELVEAFGLADVAGRPAGSLSGGQRRRLEIARALVSQPQVLFLDEPTVGLDPRIRHELIDLIRDLHLRSEMTILLTTHYLDEAERLCDRVAIMHRGQIVALDSPAALLARLGEEILELRVDDMASTVEALRARGIAGDDAFTVGSTLTVPLRGLSGVHAATQVHELGLRPHSVGSRRPTLDDVYLQLTGDRLGAAA